MKREEKRSKAHQNASENSVLQLSPPTLLPSIFYVTEIRASASASNMWSLLSYFSTLHKHNALLKKQTLPTSPKENSEVGGLTVLREPPSITRNECSIERRAIRKRYPLLRLVARSSLKGGRFPGHDLSTRARQFVLAEVIYSWVPYERVVLIAGVTPVNMECGWPEAASLGSARPRWCPGAESRGPAVRTSNRWRYLDRLSSAQTVVEHRANKQYNTILQSRQRQRPTGPGTTQ